MERREDIGARLTAGVGRARVPEGMRERIEAAVGGSSPGRERVPGSGAGLVGVAAAMALALAAGVWTVTEWSAVPPVGGQVAEATVTPDAGLLAGGGLAGLLPVSISGQDPLRAEARRVWQDFNRIRSTVEGPMRSLGDIGKSL